MSSVPSESLREAAAIKQAAAYADCYRWSLTEAERAQWVRNLSPALAHLRVFSAGVFFEARGHDWERENLDEGILIYCTLGKGYYVQDGQQHEIQPGDLLYAPPRTHHRYRADAENPWTLYWMQLSGTLLADYQRLLGLVEQGPVRHIGVHNDIILEFTRLVSEPLAPPAEDRSWLRIQANAMAVLGRIVALPQNIAEVTGAYGPIQKAITLMDDSLNKEFDLRGFAKAAGCSDRHFSRLFQRVTGQPPGNWFTQQKIRRACMLFTIPGIQVKEVAFRLGYQDPLYFSRVFRRIVGVPPEAYRQKVSGHQWSGSGS
jgi:AraC-like DNA-binding protein/quercetin dioxygenase-like cupin family protein